MQRGTSLREEEGRRSRKWHVGPREGETPEEGNLDPGMNDPQSLGARGEPLSPLSLSSLFTPLGDLPRAPIPPSSPAAVATTPPGSVPPIPLPPLCALPSLGSLYPLLLRSSPFDQRHPFAVHPPPPPPSPQAASFLFRVLVAAPSSSLLPSHAPTTPRRTLALCSNLSRGGRAV